MSHYRCDGDKRLQVTYLQAANGQSFAVLPLEGRPTLLVSAMVASGVRYEADGWVWWSKGKGGDLYRQRSDTPDTPVLGHCAETR